MNPRYRPGCQWLSEVPTMIRSILERRVLTSPLLTEAPTAMQNDGPLHETEFSWLVNPAVGLFGDWTTLHWPGPAADAGTIGIVASDAPTRRASTTVRAIGPLVERRQVESAPESRLVGIAQPSADVRRRPLV